MSAPPALAIARIDAVIRTGSGAPARARTTAGNDVVLKLKGAGGGEAALLTELIGLRLARACGVRAPSATPVWIPQDFPWQAGTDEYDDMVRRSAGWNLAIDFIPQAEDVRADALATLSDAFTRPLAAIDLLLVNVDRTKKNPNLMRDAAGRAWAIDFGACLFLHRLVAGRLDRPTDLPAGHFLAAAIAPPPASPPPETIDDALAAAPDEWLWGVGRATLAARLNAYCA